MINYKIGYNFDEKIIPHLERLNKDNKNAKIVSVYASALTDAWLSARPAYRLPNVEYNELKYHINMLHSIGIEFHYTLNASYIGNKKSIESHIDDIKHTIKTLEDLNIDCFIISHPLLMDIVYKNSSVPIAISSAVNIFSVNQIGYLHEKFKCRSVCLAPNFNRDINKLEKIQANIKPINCTLELIANELCGLGYNCGLSSSPCIYRESCFDCHSQNITKQDDFLLDRYPQGICIHNRDCFDDTLWAKLRIIRPEDIMLYSGIGINNFKITGRTAKTEDLLRVISAYMNFNFDGDLSELWYMDGKNKTIDNKSLSGLLDYWFYNRHHQCDQEMCGVSCNYCNQFIESVK